MKLLKQLRNMAGVALLDWPRYRRALRRAGDSKPAPRGWVSLCNRIEQLTPNPDGPGVQCEWMWGSELHACDVWRRLGRDVMCAALREWPIRFADRPASREGPRVSFIFAHAGRDRVTQLCRTIHAVFAQQDVQVECIVVGQSPSPVEGNLPDGIRFRHLDKSNVAPGWHKSWAYNVGARIATGDVLIFQDGDVCPPQRYASEVARTILQDGYDVASIQRFLFYLDPATTRRIEECNSLEIGCTPERVFQNWKGGTIAVRREAFFNLGGFDEGFVDWGGEDDEFYHRCSAVRHCRFGYVPFVHLWHRPQPDRKASDNPNISRIMPWRLGIPVKTRIAELVDRKFGNPETPDPGRSYKSLSTLSPGIETSDESIARK
ncbi:MAG: glycosyltransferase [Planctomycetes bacterium]|nr:glycosyltransferase [Planctomycetota bacterium]